MRLVAVNGANLQLVTPSTVVSFSAGLQGAWIAGCHGTAVCGAGRRESQCFGKKLLASAQRYLSGMAPVHPAPWAVATPASGGAADAGAAQSLITVPGAGLPYVALAAKQPQRVVLHRVFDPQQGELPANPAQICLAGVNSLCRCAKSDKRVVRQLFHACQTTAHMAVGGRGQCPPGRVAGQFAAIPAIPALFASDGDAMKTNSPYATFVMPWPTCQPTG